MNEEELKEELLEYYPEGADKIQTYMKRILDLYDVGGLNNIKTLVTIDYYCRRYALTWKIEVGGSGWEPGSDSTTFAPLLGADIEARYSNLDEYWADLIGRSKLAEDIRKDCLAKISDLLCTEVQNDKDIAVIGSIIGEINFK